MAKLKLIPSPTFKFTVEIPVAGARVAPVEFVFKHRTKDQLTAFMAAREEKSDVETVMEFAQGWDLDEPFNAQAVSDLLQNYIGAPVAIYQAYIAELTRAKLGN